MTQFVSRVNQKNLKSQAIDEILRYIDTMDLSVDHKLPKEDDFCKILGVSRVTLRSALEKLETEGLIFRKRGKGTFVNVHSIHLPTKFTPVQEMKSLIRKSGYTPKTILVDYHIEEANEEVAQKLELSPKEPVFLIEKAYYADNEFCAYIKDYVPLTYLKPDGLGKEDFTMPIFELLQKEADILVPWDKVDILTCLGKDIPYIKELIQNNLYENKSLLLLKSVYYDSKDRPVFYGWEHIDTDVIQFSMIRTHES